MISNHFANGEKTVPQVDFNTESVSQSRNTRLHILNMLNSTQRLFQQLHQDDNPEWRRASGNMYCWICLQQYRKHPYFDEQTCFGHPVDHRLCNGDVVHL